MQKMDIDPFKNINMPRDADAWCSQSFFTQQRTQTQNSSRQSIDTATPITSNKSSIAASSRVIINIPPPKQPSSTPKGTPKSFMNKKGQKHVEQRQSRSQSVRGATNLSKETRLLKSKLDRLFISYQQTVEATSQSQNTQFESLKLENQQLRAQLNELETETLRQFSELEDLEELLLAMNDRRLTLEKGVCFWKGECEQLTKEVVFLKEAVGKNKNQRESLLPEWGFRNEKLVESSFKKIGKNASKERNVSDWNKENPTKIDVEHRDDDDASPSLIAARGIFGNEIPTSFINAERHCDDQSSQHGSKSNNGKTFRRKSFHAMTLRSRQGGKNHQL